MSEEGSLYGDDLRDAGPIQCRNTENEDWTEEGLHSLWISRADTKNICQVDMTACEVRSPSECVRPTHLLWLPLCPLLVRLLHLWRRQTQWASPHQSWCTGRTCRLTPDHFRRTGKGVRECENIIHLFHASNTNVGETPTFLISSIARLMALASDPMLTTNIAVVTLFIASAVAS